MMYERRGGDVSENRFELSGRMVSWKQLVHEELDPIRSRRNPQPRALRLEAAAESSLEGSRTRGRERPLASAPTVRSPTSHLVYLHLSRGMHPRCIRVAATLHPLFPFASAPRDTGFAARDLYRRICKNAIEMKATNLGGGELVGASGKERQSDDRVPRRSRETLNY